MTVVSYSPIKKIIVHEVVDMKLDDLLRERITPAGSMPLYWCNGILFSFSSAPMVRNILKDYLDGTIHWMEVHYSALDNFSSILELTDENYGGTVKIRIIDTSKSSSLHSDFIDWLKKHK